MPGSGNHAENALQKALRIVLAMLPQDRDADARRGDFGLRHGALDAVPAGGCDRPGGAAPRGRGPCHGVAGSIDRAGRRHGSRRMAAGGQGDPWTGRSGTVTAATWKTVKLMPRQVVWRLDETTDRVLGQAGKPDRGRAGGAGTGSWSGHVQSGKTANYIGLIVQGRRRRLQADRDTRRHRQRPPEPDPAAGGRGFPRVRHPVPAALRRGPAVVLDRGRHPAGRAAAQGRLPDHQRRERRLQARRRREHQHPDRRLPGRAGDQEAPAASWTTCGSGSSRSRGSRPARADKKIVRDVPVLVIDDEADNASVNVAAVDEDTDPSRVNAAIRHLLESFEKAAYVGYTATPFANIYIDPVRRPRPVRRSTSSPGTSSRACSRRRTTSDLSGCSACSPTTPTMTTSSPSPIVRPVRDYAELDARRPQEGLGPARAAAGIAAARRSARSCWPAPRGGPAARSTSTTRCSSTSPGSRTCRIASPTSSASTCSCCATGSATATRTRQSRGRGTARAVGTGLRPHDRLVPGRPGTPRLLGAGLGPGPARRREDPGPGGQRHLP